MGKIQSRRSKPRSEFSYIRKLCHTNHPDLNIKQETVEDLNSLANELFDQLARGAVDLLKLKAIPKTTLTAREFETYAKLKFEPQFYEKVSEASRDAVQKFKAYVKKEKSASPSKEPSEEHSELF